jgi:hypothetical protein
MLERPTRFYANVALMRRLLSLAAIVAFTASCGTRDAQVEPFVLHVLRDSSSPLAPTFNRAYSQFSLSKPHLNSRTPIIVATSEGATSYQKLLSQLDLMPPDLIIADDNSFASDGIVTRAHLVSRNGICGAKYVYATEANEQKREAANMYLEFLAAPCN